MNVGFVTIELVQQLLLRSMIIEWVSDCLLEQHIMAFFIEGIINFCVAAKLTYSVLDIVIIHLSAICFVNASNTVAF